MFNLLFHSADLLLVPYYIGGLRVSLMSLYLQVMYACSALTVAPHLRALMKTLRHLCCI